MIIATMVPCGDEVTCAPVKTWRGFIRIRHLTDPPAGRATSGLLRAGLIARVAVAQLAASSLV
ncbi:MAG: hypothetical protein NVSMB42_05890 [Herpetosiphon sp.]